MSEESIRETTRIYLNKLEKLDGELSELLQNLKSGTTENSGRESLLMELETPASHLDESQQLRSGIETIQEAFRSIRTEVVKLADLSDIQLAEDSRTESKLSSTSSKVRVDMAKHVIGIVARDCQQKTTDT